MINRWEQKTDQCLSGAGEGSVDGEGSQGFWVCENIRYVLMVVGRSLHAMSELTGLYTNKGDFYYNKLHLNKRGFKKKKLDNHCPRNLSFQVLREQLKNEAQW